jgi:peptide deformylase
MSIRPIITLPDPQLRLVSQKVTRFDASLQQLVTDMFETMYDAPGVGLAAIQIAVPMRVVTVDVSPKEDEPQPMVFINPDIIARSEEMNCHQEGCLSIPDYYEEVERPATVTVRYQTVTGETHDMICEGLLATCIQHEIDHLNGTLFIDHISRLKRERVTKKFIKAARRDGDA